MARRRTLVLAAALVAAGLAGCLTDDTPDPEVAMTLSVHPPDEDIDNRSDIDDFETLVVRIHAHQVYTTGNDRTNIFPRTSYDFVDIAGDDPTELDRTTVDPDSYDKFTVRVEVEEVLHENGSRPEIHTPGAGVYVQNFPGNASIPLDQGETLEFLWHFAVTEDDEDVENPQVPEGEYYLRLLPKTGPVR